MLERFAGDVERFSEIDVAGLIAWITSIDLAEWPQQRRLDDGLIRPAMISDPAWHGFGEIAAPIVNELLVCFPGCGASTHLLSVVMPGHSIEPHTDGQPANWLCRVHVPLTTSDRSEFIVAGRRHWMKPGEAYRVNTEAVHAVTNGGDTPRIHFMFDVRLHA